MRRRAQVPFETAKSPKGRTRARACPGIAYRPYPPPWRRLAGASDHGAVAGAVCLEAACGEPDDVGVDRDLDDGVAGAVVLPARAGAETPARACCQVPGPSWRIRCCWP